MKSLAIMNTREIKELHKILKKQYDFNKKLDYVFLINNKNRIYIITDNIREINLETLRIDRIGLYIGELFKEKKEFRPSWEGSQIIGKNAEKNIIELKNEKQFTEWMKGLDVEIDLDNNKSLDLDCYLIVKYKEDIIGTGRYNKKEKKLMNYVSKSRRLSTVNV
jgi:NOL1/NOP2/fmu family ribosome biogenesis protein